jgi:hypothetical protein
MESLFLFAKILLDRSAYALQYYFGRFDGPGKKPLGSGKLMKKWDAFVAAKCLAQTATFQQAADDLRCIADFRDLQIAHESDSQTCRGGVQCTPDGLILLFGLSYPKPEDKAHPQSLTAQEVFVKLDAYVKAFIGLIVANKARCVLRLAAN